MMVEPSEVIDMDLYLMQHGQATTETEVGAEGRSGRVLRGMGASARPRLTMHENAARGDDIGREHRQSVGDWRRY